MKSTIESNRIVLRKLRRSDADDIYAHVRNRQIRQNTLIPFPYQHDDALRFIRQSHADWRSRRGYHFGMEWRVNRRIIGAVGIQKPSRIHRRAEIGYWLSQRYRGRGLMTEAVLLALQFAFDELRLHRVEACVFPHNPASVRVLEKAGFVHEGVRRQSIRRGNRYLDELIFSILRHEWHKRPDRLRF